MCNCITKTENETLLLLQKKNPDKEVSRTDMQEVGFSMKGSVTFNTIKYHISGKTKSIHIYHSYCPFCGEKYPKLS